MKTLFAAASLALMLAGCAAPALADAILRPSVVVDGDVVHLSDIFDNAGPNGSQVVAHAPLPGQRVVVDADWLQHIAAMNGLDWKTDNPFLELVIARNGIAVGREQITERLRAALQKEGISPDAQIELVNRDIQLIVPVGQPASVAVTDLYYDSQYKRFSATLVAPADATDPARLSVSGQVFETIEVPVVAHPIMRGATIATSDLNFVRMRQDRVGRDVVTDIDQIIGMAPRQSMRAGQTVQLNQLQRPVAVARGALVTMVLRQDSMRLTAQGRAIDQGSVGDVIRVANTRSNMTLSARIEGENLVSVGMNGAAPPAPAGIAANSGDASGVALAN